MNRTPSSRWRSPVATVGTATAVAGSLDIAYVLIFTAVRGGNPQRILLAVASGVLGPAAFDGGIGTAALGLALHYIVALLWTVVFLLLSRRWPPLVSRPRLIGPLYGALIFGAMNFVVLPLSAVPFIFTFRPLATTTDFLSHRFFVGLPIALLIARHRHAVSRE